MTTRGHRAPLLMCLDTPIFPNHVYIKFPSNFMNCLGSELSTQSVSVLSFRMQIFNISDLFATPVAATTGTLNKTSCKRRRKRAKVALPITNSVHLDGEKNDDESTTSGLKAIAFSDETDNTVAIKKKRQKKKRNPKAAEELLSQPTTNTNHSNATNLGNNVDDNTEHKVTEDMKEEVRELMNSLESITSQRNDMERSLNELREENDRLVRSNEDLKDELKEMTDEALELSVEKQRLLSKIGTLKKQLLNRPK